MTHENERPDGAPRGNLGGPRGSAPVQQRLNDIFEVAAEQLHQRGFSRTRLDDIADVLGVTRAALYYYFKSKDDLIEFVCTENMDRAARVLEEANREPGVLARLYSFARHYLPVITADAAIVTIRERAELRPEFRRALMARAQKISEGVEQIIQDGVAEGVLQPATDARVASLALLGMLNWSSQWYRNADIPLDDVVDAFLRVFLLGVAAPGAEKQLDQILEGVGLV
jgi:AcrR family transcriptional regulator